jgi:hypothetical protein
MVHLCVSALLFAGHVIMGIMDLHNSTLCHTKHRKVMWYRHVQRMTHIRRQNQTFVWLTSGSTKEERLSGSWIKAMNDKERI